MTSNMMRSTVTLLLYLALATSGKLTVAKSLESSYWGMSEEPNVLFANPFRGDSTIDRPTGKPHRNIRSRVFVTSRETVAIRSI